MTEKEKASFITTATQTLLKQMEEDITKTETGLDSTYQFAPLCWLESSFTNYAADISSYTILEPNVPYSVMLSALTEKITAMTNPKGPKPGQIKFILVLCQLILLMPVHKTSPDVNICLTELLKMRFGSSTILKEFQDLVYESIDQVIVFSVVSGSNPVPGLLLVQQEKKNVIGLVQSLRIGNHNVSTYRCVLGAIIPFITELQQNQRAQFCVEFYHVLGCFNAEHPATHHEILQLSANQAQMVIDSILKWHSSPEPEELPIMCALLPFCTFALQDMIANKKSPYHAIFKALGDYKFKKGGNNEGPAFAFLELFAAMTHTINFKNKDAFKPIIDFLTKARDRFEKTIFTTKEKFLTGALFTEFLPRYAAVEFVKGEGPAKKYLFDQAQYGAGWQPLATFFYLTTDGYPMLNTSISFPDTIYAQMGQKLSDCLQLISIESTEVDKQKDATDVAIAIAKYLTQNLKGDPIISSLTRARGDPVKEWELSRGLNQFLTALKSNITISSTFCSIIKGIVHGPRKLTDELIPLIMIIWAAVPFWANFNPSDSSKIIQELGVEFRQDVNDAVQMNSQNLSQLPALFLSYLRWSEGILIGKHNKPNKKARFTEDIRQNYMHVLNLLRGTCGSSRAFDLSESLCDHLFVVFELPPNPKFPYTDVPKNDVYIQAGVKAVLNAWFGYIQKFTEVKLPATVKEPKFVPSAERISIMTEFVCRFIDDSAIITTNGQNIGATAKHFFNALFVYIQKLQSINVRLGLCFQYLHPTALSFLQPAFDEHVLRPFIVSNFKNPYFWINVTEICAGCALIPELPNEIYHLLEKIAPICLSSLQFDTFQSKTIFIKAIARFITAMYGENGKNVRDQSRWTSVIITVTDALYHAMDRSSPNYSDNVIDTLFSIFPVLLHGYAFGAGEECLHTPDIDVETKRTRDMFYVLGTFNKLTHTILTPQLVNYIYASLLEILAANPVTAWRHITVFAESVDNLLKTIIVEAFTEFLGMQYTIMCRMNVADILMVQRIDPVINPTETDPKKRDREIKQKTKELKASYEKLASYARSLRKPTTLKFDTTEHNKLIDYLTSNDFAFFQNPPTQIPQIIASAVRCVAESSQIHQLFDKMTNLFIQSGKSLSGNFELFFTSFFRAISEGWKLVPSLKIAINKNVEKFIQSLQPPNVFAYFFVRFSKLVNDVNCCQTLFSKCFLLPLLTCPMDYAVPGRFKQLAITEFVSRITQSEEYSRFISGILQAELIYIPFRPASIDIDREIVLSIIGTNNSAFSVLQTQNTSAPAIPLDLIAIQASRWMVPAGTTKNGSKLFLIRLSRIPQVSPVAVAANFELQIQNVNQIEIAIFVDSINAYVKAGFPEFLKLLPEGLIDRIFKIYVTQVNILALGDISKIDASLLGEKIVGAEDITQFFKDDTGVHFPHWALPYEKTQRAFANVVTPKGATNTLLICEEQFVLKSPPAADTPKVFGVPLNTYLEIPYSIITSLSIEADCLMVRYKLPTGLAALKLKTQAAQMFINAYNIMGSYCNFQPPIVSSIVETHSAPSIRAECIALSLHLLSLQSNYFMIPALHLFETSIRNAKFSSDSVLPAGPIATFAHLFDELEREKITDDVVPRLGSYMKAAPPASCIPLLPLIAIYLNRENNTEKISQVVDSIIQCSKGEVVLSAINQFLWAKINSKTAIEIAVTHLLRSEISTSDVGQVFREFVEHNASIIGQLLIDRVLDGTIRRNPFENGILPSRIFGSMRTLAFEKPEFIEGRFAPLIFGCIFGAVHSDQKVVDDIKIILQSVCETLSHTKPEIATGILLQCQTVRNLLNHHREMSVSALVTAGDELCGSFSEEDRQRYRGYISNTDAGENPNMWYIKAAAMVQMGNGNPSFVNRFVDLMPSLFELEPGHLRLELCFNTLVSLIPQVSPQSLTPIVILWPALFAASHPNNHLRCAALRLLAVCIDFAFKNGQFKNIGGIESSSYISTTLIESLGAFRESFGGDLSSSFIYLLVCALSRGFEEAETRTDAITVAKSCINALKERQFLATHFLMPLIAYTNEDVLSLSQLFSQKTTPPDVIFENFDQRREVDQMFIVAYLENCVADRFCQANTSKIADCLIVGATRYPAFFRPVMARVVEKCWRMIDVKTLGIDQLDVYATLSANFLSIPDTGVDYSEEVRKFQFERVVDNNLTKIIKKGLNGVTVAVKLIN